ncbi:hypothetical protein L1049_013075 [Liquidambar formosana]|uniref:RING-type E3 ubiquitin transferase n=1 Tax=Liquidambar formosana TaxID=63359 RepID=A0AAP0RJQ0_LIQFO
MDSSPNQSPKHEKLSCWNPLVISIVGATCTIFLFFSYYRILKRHCCVLSSRNRAQRQLLNEDNPDDPSLQFHSRGLDSTIMHSIPITQFKKSSEEELSQSNTDCAVCLGEFEEGEWIKNLPNCSHAFHVSCIDTWFQSHSNCPLCRSDVFDLNIHNEYSISMYSLLETLRREDFFQERAAYYQNLRSEILENSALRREPANAS